MSIIREIRQLTGLSQEKLADWLGVSKSMLQFAEKGERNLPGAASHKLIALIQPVQQLKESVTAIRPGPVPFTRPANLAQKHRKKMALHLRTAERLQQQLDALQVKHPKFATRLALLELVKTIDTALYTATEGDKKWAEMMEWFSNERMPGDGTEERELLHDKIDTHQAYAELHRQMLEKYEAMVK